MKPSETADQQTAKQAGQNSTASNEKLRKAEAREALLTQKQQVTEELKEKSDLKVAQLMKQLEKMKGVTDPPTLSPTEVPTAAPTNETKWWTKRLKNISKSEHFRTPADEEAAVDCKVGEWGSGGQCSKPCDGGEQSQTRKVLIEPSGSGQKCAALEQQIKCNLQPCCFPHCPPDVSKQIRDDMTWIPPDGCSCKSHTYCDMKSLLTRGPKSGKSTGEVQPGSQMWCHTRENTEGCEHGWAWCAQHLNEQNITRTELQ